MIGFDFCNEYGRNPLASADENLDFRHPGRKDDWQWEAPKKLEHAASVAMAIAGKCVQHEGKRYVRILSVVNMR